MRAVILAAGRGGRLSGITNGQPKCLARVGAWTLMERQLRALRDCGIDTITVVAGYQVDRLRRVCGPSVDFVDNRRFASTDSLYSLWLARQRLVDGFVALNGDVLFHRQLLADLLTARYEDALLAAARGVNEVYGEEEMKVRVRAGRVTHIAKHLDPAEADGESLGIVKFGVAGSAVLIEEMNRRVASGRGRREWLPAAFEGFCQRRPLYIVESRGLPWIEIDVPEDYWRACTEVLPAIDAADRRGPVAALERRTSGAAPGRTFRHV